MGRPSPFLYMPGVIGVVFYWRAGLGAIGKAAYLLL